MKDQIPESCGTTSTPTSQSPTFEERLAARIADIVSARVIEACVGQAGGVTFQSIMRLSGQKLFGCRLSQFERFCQLMRENPAEVPYRTARRVMQEVHGVGGYTSATSLLRYALAHTRFWKGGLYE